MQKSLKPKSLLFPIIVCTIAAFFYLYDFVLRVLPQAMITPLMSNFGVHARGIGILASLFFWGYAPMQIPSGMLYDRFSPRKIMTTTIFLSALATLGFAVTQNFVLASFFRFVMGFMTAFAFVGALVVGAQWFRGQYFAFYTGLVQFLGCLGAILGITPVTLLMTRVGWRGATIWIAVIGFILALIVFLIVKDAPNRSAELHVYPASHYKKAFTHAQTWWVALYGFAIWAPITIFATTWGLGYLENTYRVSMVIAGNFVSIIWLSIGISGPIVGWISKHFKSRRWPMWTCATIGFVSASLLVLSPALPRIALYLCLIGYGIGSSAQVLPFGLIVDIQPPQAIGAVVGFTNMAVIFSGLILLPAVGFIVQHAWSGQLVNGLPVYTHDDYSLALLMLPACFLLAFLTTFLIKETHCEKQHVY